MLVTGADGFVGCRLVRRLSEEGHSVLAGVRPLPEGGTDRARTGTIPADVPQVPIELDDPGSLDAAVAGPLEAVIHLAAVASGAEAHRDPVGAWAVNTVGTVRLLHALEQRPGGEAVVFVLASTGEVYGAGPEMPRVEADPTAPRSPYAASKLAAEVAVFEAHRRWGVGGIVARAFSTHGCGAGRAVRRSGVCSPARGGKVLRGGDGHRRQLVARPRVHARERRRGSLHPAPDLWRTGRGV